MTELKCPNNGCYGTHFTIEYFKDEEYRVRPSIETKFGTIYPGSQENIMRRNILSCVDCGFEIDEYDYPDLVKKIMEMYNIKKGE